jgi:hypothetical protein
MKANQNGYINQLLEYNSILDKKYGKIGKYYQPKAYRLALKLDEWKRTSDKQNFVKSYEDSYSSLIG